MDHVIFLGIDLRVLAIGQHDAPLHNLMPISLSEIVERMLQRLTLAPLLLIVEEANLLRGGVRDEARTADPHAP